jgi:DNA replication and repair protein RecF
LKIKKLQIRNIRNIEEINISCSEGIHFIHGQNGQGKTTILEAIYILSNLRSFRDSDLAAALQYNEHAGQIRGLFEIDPETHAELKIDLIQNPQRFEKRAYVNHKLSKSAADYYGVKLQHSPIQFHAINLNPTSTDLIRGEPALRRNYFNQVISSQNQSYMNTLKRYQKIVDQKNALLKDEEKRDDELLKILNEGLIQEGAKILFERYRYLSKLVNPVQQFLTNIAPLQHRVILGYKSRKTLYFTGHFEPQSIKILEEILHQELMNLNQQERVRKTCLVGPHRDDFIFAVETTNANLVDVGSQGEIRSFLLALKLAELEEFKHETGVQPVLLIDDFSSELDSHRRGYLLNYLKNSDLQIFVTSTDDLTHHFQVNDVLQGKGIQIIRGKVQE